MESLFSGSFEDFSLPPTLLQGLKDLGYASPTRVQQAVFKAVQSQKDLIVQSHTGSGKTTAFCLPMLCQIDPSLLSPQSLVLVPTRELARQVALECTRLAHHHNIRVAAIYGGASFEAQIASLKSGAQVLIATPGRFKDLFERRLVDLSHIKIAILDEADEMLSMGFWDDVTYLLGKLPKEHQSLLFSATLPTAIERTINNLLKEPVTINLSSDQVSAKSIRHVIHLENELNPKSRNLLYALEFHSPKQALIFCNTKDETEVIERYLRRFGFRARALNGDLSQSARERVMDDLKNKTIDLIIATDVAARGIDISGLTHVFNYELPENDEVYVHRTGRTGRIGSTGTAVNLIRSKDEAQWESLKSRFDFTAEIVELPSEKELMWMQAERLAILLTEEADGVEISQYRPVAQSMLHRGDLSEILAFLLRSHYAKQGGERSERAAPAPRQEFKPREKAAPAPRPAPRKMEERKSEELPKEPLMVQEEDRPEFTKLYITLGQNDGIKDLTSLASHLSVTTGVDLGHFTGMGHVRETSSHVEVDTEVASSIIECMNGKPRGSGSEKVLCEVARPFSKPARPYHNRRPGRR